MNLTFGQNATKSYKLIYETGIYKYSEDSYRLVQIGDSLYNKSINDEQRIYSLLTSGLGYYNLKNYSSSLKVSKKADSIARKNGINEHELRTSLLLYNIYSNSEYKSYSDDQKQRIHTLLSKRKIDKTYRNVVKAINLNLPYIDLYTSKYVKIKDSLKKEVDYFEEDEISQNSITNHINSLLRLANLYRVDNDYDNAKHYYDYSSLLKEKNGISDELIDLKINFGLGDIALNDNNFQVSYKYFNKALEIAKLNNLEGSIKVINSKLVELNSLKKDDAEKIEYLNRNSTNSKSTIFNNPKFSNYIFLFIVFISILSFYLFLKQRRRQTKDFENIVNNLNNSTIIPQVLDNEIFDVLRKIEKEKEFMSRNISVASIVYKYKISSKELIFILNKYYNRNFEEFISYLKIINIIKQLKNNPELLKYDINRISEIAGFSSKMKFETTFKKETNISPSLFIKLLQKKYKSQ